MKIKQITSSTIIVIPFLALLLINSCTQDNRLKIGFMLPGLTLDRCARERDFFSDKVKELGGEVIATEAQNSDQLQISQAQELVRQGVKVLVVMSVNNVTAAAIVRYAHDHDVKVIAYERIISNCDLDYFLTFDNVKIGELMAAYAIKYKPTGKYLLFGGDKRDQNAVWVKQGQHNIIDPFVQSGKISIAYDTYIEDWSGENAKHEMTRFLNFSDNIPDVILSSNDGMAIGIVQALEEEGVNSFPMITGQDAELSACQNIVRGKQSVTIYKSLKLEAETAAVMAMECARSEIVKNTDKKIFNGKIDVTSILISPQSVDKTNLESTVIADNFLKKSDIYKIQ